ncbi:predicted protein [Sparassis crispa]|uniref:DUF1776-domain-containing protein n=1 Tax=Sparassis crispa TaxID=139825 RepID=A0A401GHT1_9APHY|nr:predicted protein [Sparassis crispa]GBE81750.1 predicted protein [Sparassis crispa]
MDDDMPTTLEQIEEYLESLEDYLLSSLQAVTPDLPHVNEAMHRLWEDVSRFGPKSLPSLPDIHLPGIGPFEVPPPPPPPPPPKKFWEESAHWVSEHPWTTAGIGVGVVGAGLLVGYGSFHIFTRRSRRTKAAVGTASTERRQVVVVLGGDHPSGLPLVLELERKGYIVIISVSTPERVDELERRSRGYVRALVLDPADPETIPYFLRSLASTMSRRFPVTAAGDPHLAPSTHLYVHSVISLLTLPLPATVPAPAPLEHLSLRDTYASYLQTTHISPLQVLQAMMPLLRTSAARARDSVSQNLGKKSIIVCLPAMDGRVGLPFASAQAMSAAATLRGVEVLRREIRVAALTDPTESMKNIKVVVVDVGAIGTQGAGGKASMDEWTQGEKLAYGPAFSSVAQGGFVYRKPTSTAVFVDTLINIVSNGRKRGNVSPLRHALGRILEWVRGDRVAVGSGAGTYTLASQLPALVLDALLNIPHFLVSIRNALLPVPPRVAPDPSVPPVVPATVPPTAAVKKPETEESPFSSDQEHLHDHELSETGSEADVESNEGDASGVGESWVSLKGKLQGHGGEK